VRLSWACWAPARCGRLDAEEGARGLKQGVRRGAPSGSRPSLLLLGGEVLGRRHGLG
jgi:hypothetical protein